MDLKSCMNCQLWDNEKDDCIKEENKRLAAEFGKDCPDHKYFIDTRE